MTRLKAFVSNPVDSAKDEPQAFIALEYVESGTGRLLPGIELPEKSDPTAIAHQAGDVRFGKLRPYLAKSVLMDAEGIGSGELLVLRPKPGVLDSRFLWYLTLSKPFLEWAEVTSYGVKMPRTNWTSLGAWEARIPSFDEQARIVEVLDAEMRRIDFLLNEGRRLMALTRERSHNAQRQLSVQGCRPAVMRSAEVDWLESIPKHWRIVRLKYEAKLESGHTPSRTQPELWSDCTIPWISLNDVGQLTTHEYISETVNQISEAGLNASSARILPAGTVVVSRDATIGRTSIMAIPMATSQHFADWVCGPNIDPRYLWLLLTTAMQDYFDSLTDGATLRTIGMPDVRALTIPLPPLAEQREIVSEAEAVRVAAQKLTEELSVQIDLLHERRQALITAAVWPET